MTEDEAALVAAVEAGDAPLAVYADWLEDQGDERAVGMRWLADHDRRPRFDIVRAGSPQVWQWHVAREIFMRNQLPHEPLAEHLKHHFNLLHQIEFGSFGEALDVAAEAVTAAMRAGQLE